MLFKFIATAVLAAGVAGIIIAINRISGSRVPKWVLPTGIATAIIGFQIFDEYNWYSRKRAALADNYVIINEFHAKKIWRPWTYLNAPVSSIMVINMENQQAVNGEEGMWTNTIFTTSYLGETQHIPFVFDCINTRFGPYYGELNTVFWGATPEIVNSKLCP